MKFLTSAAMALEIVTFCVRNFPTHCKLVLLLSFLLQVNIRLTERDLCDPSTLIASDSSAVAADEEEVQLLQETRDNLQQLLLLADHCDLTVYNGTRHARGRSSTAALNLKGAQHKTNWHSPIRKTSGVLGFVCFRCLVLPVARSLAHLALLRTRVASSESVESLEVASLSGELFIFVAF